MKFEINSEDLFEYKNKNEKYILIDMRSPKEFFDYHIPESINFPILDDAQRKTVGTLFDNGEIDKAKSIAVKYASNKLPLIFDDLLNLINTYDHVVLYCARGGYRSSVLFNFLKTLGLSVEKLIGGYKAYRKYICHNLDQLIFQKQFIVLHGKTGVGKTEILKKLKLNGISTIDLELLANHRGSSFGHLGLSSQPSQKQFESFLHDSLLETSNIVCLEGESSRIGNILLPKSLIQAMKNGKNIVIEDTLENRIKRIKNDYISGTTDEINEAFDNLSKYISSDRINNYKKHILANNYEYVIKDLITNYYDSHYAITYTKDDPHFMNDDNILKNILEYIKGGI